MSLRDRLNAIADRVRAIPARSSFDERTSTVTVRTRTWAGGRSGAEGGSADAELVLTPRPVVAEIKQRDIASSGGRYVAGDIKVGPITPAYPGGGYTPAQLAPVPTTNGVQILYILTGPFAGTYRRIDIETTDNHAYFLILRRDRATP